MNFMLIRRFFMYFADFRANFCGFMTIVLFYWLEWVLKRPLLLAQILDNKWLQFFGYESFFVDKCDKKWLKLELFLLIFCSFVFFSVFGQVS